MEVAGSAVGVASLGITVCQGLLSYYDGWKDYESDVAGARDSITDLQHTLTLLKEGLERGGLDGERKERVKSCLESCTGGLTELSRKLDELRKHDNPEGLRQKARAGGQRLLYPFRKDKVAKLQGNVADVRGRLQIALQVLQLAVQQSDRWRNIVNWLSPPDPWENHRSARQRHESQTGAWLLQCDQYLDWKNGKVQHLWISGKPGCGKTVLCSTVIEDIKQHCHNSNSGLGIFYFTFSDRSKQSYQDLLRSLVGQLAWKEPGISLLQQAYDKPNRSVPGEDEMERILQSSLQSYDQIFVTLDALDESPEDGDSRQTMLEKLEQLTQNTSKVKIMATSRPIRDVRDSMGILKAEHLPLASSSVNLDIRRYVATQLSHDRRFSRLDTRTIKLIEETLSTQADGMFRWAYCQLQELKKLKSTKPRSVKDALRTLPATLDGIYERMLCGIESRDRGDALTLLRWLAYARSPPTLGQLSEATVIDPFLEGGVVEIDNRGHYEDTLDILSGLVIVVGTNEDEHNQYDSDGIHDHSSEGAIQEDLEGSDHGVGRSHRNRRVEATSMVRLAHFSVKEYLQSERILQTSAKDFHLKDSREHKSLAQSCLTYIACYSKNEAKMSEEEDLQTFPLLRYAARSWYYHSSLQDRDNDMDTEVSFLDCEKTRMDWLCSHQPDKPWTDPFNDCVEDAGSGLYYASHLGLEKAVYDFLAQGANINAQGGHFGNALQAASARGHEKVIEMLLAKGADVNAQGGHYGNALQTASVEGYEKVVEMLLAKGADINAQGGYYGNALQAASYYSHEKVVEMLLAKGADIDAQGGMHGNALQAASAGDSEKVVEMLLAKGADVNAQGGHYGNALQTASVKGYEKVVEMLLAKGADINAQGGIYGNALQAASYYSHEKVVEMLLAEGADVDAQGGMHGNALQAASAGDSEKVVEMLLAKGADVNTQGGDYGNALQAASAGGHEKVVEMLLAKGADVNTQGGDYGNALQAASYCSHEKVVEILLAKGADINAQGGIYGNALQAASYCSHEKVVEMLLAEGADVDAQGGMHGNALQAASAGDSEKVVEMLLAKGADVNTQGGDYGNALQAASYCGHDKVVEILTAAGARQVA